MLDVNAWKMGLNAYREGNLTLQANPFKGRHQSAILAHSWEAGWLAGMHADVHKDGLMEITGWSPSGAVYFQ